MDRQPEDFQFLGFFGIYKESFKIIFKWRKIFSKITLAFILPFTFVNLAQNKVSQLFFSKTINNQSNHNPTPSEWVFFILFEVGYLVFLLMFFLLSTSAVVYPIASIYTNKEPTFKKVMTAIPKVWKPLMVTFLWAFLIFFLYNVVAVVILALVLFIFSLGSLGTTPRVAISIVFVILYLIGVVYITIVWNLASVISVLEDFKGIKAMTKSKNLIKGKMWVAFVIYIVLGIVFSFIEFGFETVVVQGENLGIGIGIRVLCGIVFFLLLMLLFLFGLVAQSVFYLVCKSYHHEIIDKSLLADHLEVLCGGVCNYQRQPEIQLEQYEA